jgi:hypothetical protein
MSTLLKNRGRQYALHAEFQFSMADAMLNSAGVLTNFKAAAGVFDVIPMPPNAVVVGGELAVEVASNDGGATATLKVGDSANDARYLAATSIKAAARTALVPTGYRGVGEDIRITLANTNGDATAGTISLRVSYIITGRAQEVQAT